MPEPTYEEAGASFVTVFHNPTQDQSDQKSIQKSTQKTLELVRQNSLIMIAELAQQTGLSDPGIKKHLKKLQEQGLLKRIGPDKGGHWEAID